MKNPGYIYDLEDGRKGILYHKEQSIKNRYIIKLFTSDFKEIVSDSTGRQATLILSAEKLNELKFIGFND